MKMGEQGHFFTTIVYIVALFTFPFSWLNGQKSHFFFGGVGSKSDMDAILNISSSNQRIERSVILRELDLFFSIKS